MPYLKLQTNIETSPDTQQALMEKLSQETARQLGKPERYVMIAIEPAASMLFAGNDTPLAYMELKSIDLPGNLTDALSQALCTLVSDTLGIASDRIYIEFSNAPRQMWGWDKGTF